MAVLEEALGEARPDEACVRRGDVMLRDRAGEKEGEKGARPRGAAPVPPVIATVQRWVPSASAVAAKAGSERGPGNRGAEGEGVSCQSRRISAASLRGLRPFHS